MVSQIVNSASVFFLSHPGFPLQLALFLIFATSMSKAHYVLCFAIAQSYTRGSKLLLSLFLFAVKLYIQKKEEWKRWSEPVFIYYFFGGLKCVCYSFAYVAHLVFLRIVWCRTQRAAVASRRPTNLATHLPYLVGSGGGGGGGAGSYMRWGWLSRQSWRGGQLCKPHRPDLPS